MRTKMLAAAGMAAVSVQLILFGRERDAVHPPTRAPSTGRERGSAGWTASRFFQKRMSYNAAAALALQASWSAVDIAPRIATGCRPGCRVRLQRESHGPGEEQSSSDDTSRRTWFLVGPGTSGCARRSPERYRLPGVTTRCAGPCGDLWRGPAAPLGAEAWCRPDESATDAASGPGTAYVTAMWPIAGRRSGWAGRRSWRSCVLAPRPSAVVRERRSGSRASRDRQVVPGGRGPGRGE